MTEDCFDPNAGEIVTVEFEDGSSMDCGILGVFTCEGKEYIALVPQDGENEDEVYLYGYEEENETDFRLLDIEDDAEYEKVSAEFDAIIDRMMAETDTDEEE